MPSLHQTNRSMLIPPFLGGSFSVHRQWDFEFGYVLISASLLSFALSFLILHLMDHSSYPLPTDAAKLSIVTLSHMKVPRRISALSYGYINKCAQLKGRSRGRIASRKTGGKPLKASENYYYILYFQSG